VSAAYVVLSFLSCVLDSSSKLLATFLFKVNLPVVRCLNMLSVPCRVGASILLRRGTLHIPER
jgi:hypothetical protein